MGKLKKKKVEAAIYVEEDYTLSNGTTYTNKGLLPVSYMFTFMISDNNQIQQLIDKYFTQEKLEQERKKAQHSFYSPIGVDPKVRKIEPTYVKKKSKYYYGEYYAHEYGEYTDGRVRRIEYNNGHVEYEIECLDKEKNVLDGVWDERINDRYMSGTGDYFSTIETTPWTKKEIKEKRKGA